ncbi:MAG: aminotransferase class I/II-fold pyridoxal phosphate-dependent enzyme [Planctomycetes bacterium]|nr:aminotransferase class I/II-fold pyridoxal phosphate-dependent enzyme [Planctomycetota bacterium]
MTHSLPSFALSERAARTVEQPIGYLMAQAVSNPNLISLAAGLVDYPTLPTQAVEQVLHELLSDEVKARLALQYGTTEGFAALRVRLLEHMAHLDGLTPADFSATADDVIVTTGSQQILFVLTDILVNPGDIVIAEWPSYFVYTGALATMGAQVRCVDMDEEGIIPEALEALFQQIESEGQLPRVKIVYTCDYHQNPTGITLSADRRPRIAEIVRKYSKKHRILLLEDAAYRELTYEGDAPPSIKRHDPRNEFVALTQTFSKPFAPGLKTGYALLPRDLVEPVLLQKGSHDFGSVNLVQHLLAAAMRSGAYAAQVSRLCGHYAHKRDAMLKALEEHLGDFEPGASGASGASGGTHWTHPRGGLYVWLTLPERFDTGMAGPLFKAAMAEGVIYVPGAFCYPGDATRATPTHAMRLSFGTATIEQIHEGVRRLAAAIRRAT